ncbi:hypothetical protein F4780DRAFT_675713 [Xylariomycetidae sp. FL0641]|nr:hypothetical protein F4780DRAFT_675713 [Xylariomycetidae sp. FL0641]
MLSCSAGVAGPGQGLSACHPVRAPWRVPCDCASARSVSAVRCIASSQASQALLSFASCGEPSPGTLAIAGHVECRGWWEEAVTAESWWRSTQRRQQGGTNLHSTGDGCSRLRCPHYAIIPTTTACRMRISDSSAFWVHILNIQVDMLLSRSRVIPMHRPCTYPVHKSSCQPSRHDVAAARQNRHVKPAISNRASCCIAGLHNCSNSGPLLDVHQLFRPRRLDDLASDLATTAQTLPWRARAFVVQPASTVLTVLDPYEDPLPLDHTPPPTHHQTPGPDSDPQQLLEITHGSTLHTSSMLYYISLRFTPCRLAHSPPLCPIDLVLYHLALFCTI